MNLTIGTIASAFFVILGSLVALFAQVGAQQQRRGSSQTARSSAASAEGEAPKVRVAVVIVPPSVIEQNGSLTGFSIDLWNAIAARLKVKTNYQIVPDGSALEEAMRSKSADLTPAVFITSTRDADFDFSYPTLGAGLKSWYERRAQQWRPQRLHWTGFVCCFRERPFNGLA